MIDLKQDVDSSWLIGMGATTARRVSASISQALQETHLTMNEQGTRAKSAVALGIQLTSLTRPKPELLIDTPFLIWFQRLGLRVPLFVGYMTEEDWKKPATL
jgi:serine protease inhibitor